MSADRLEPFGSSWRSECGLYEWIRGGHLWFRPTRTDKWDQVGVPACRDEALAMMDRHKTKWATFILTGLIQPKEGVI